MYSVCLCGGKYMAISNIGSRKNKKTGSGFLGDTGVGKSGHSTANITQSTNTTFKNKVISQNKDIAQDFSVNIMQANGTINESALEELQDVIHTTGDLLIAKPGYNTVLDYKNAVKTLLKSVLPYLHNKENVLAPKRVGGKLRNRNFTLINRVNEKLDVVLKLVMSTQANQMRIMKELDEIKGLLVNLLQ